MSLLVLMEAGRPRPALGLREGAHRLTDRPFDKFRLKRGGLTPGNDLQFPFFHRFGISLFVGYHPVGAGKQSFTACIEKLAQGLRINSFSRWLGPALLVKFAHYGGNFSK